MSEIRYAIRMTTSKGQFWWTNSMAPDPDNAGHGKFTAHGWTEGDHPFPFLRRPAADKKAAALESSLQRMFEIERIEVVSVQWSNVFGWQPVEDVAA